MATRFLRVKAIPKLNALSACPCASERAAISLNVPLAFSVSLGAKAGSISVRSIRSLPRAIATGPRRDGERPYGIATAKPPSRTAAVPDGITFRSCDPTSPRPAQFPAWCFGIATER